MFSLPTLEHQLVMYVTSEGRDTFAKAFDFSAIPVVSKEQADAEDRTKKLTTAMPTLKAPSAGPRRANKESDTVAAVAAAAQKYAQQLQQIPEIAAYGGVLKSSQVVELTESETEYVVTAVKHIFKENIVLQFDVKNTLPDTVLTDVTIVCTPGDDAEAALEEDFTIPISKLVTDVPGTGYVSFRRTDSDSIFVGGSFTNILRFTSREVDPSTSEPEETGYDDEYQVEDLELTGSDYVVPAYAGSFDNVWDQTSSGEEVSETLQLSSTKSIQGIFTSLDPPFPVPRFGDHKHLKLTRPPSNQDAVEQLVKALSLQPLDGTDVALSSSTHTLKLYGKTISGGKVAAMVRMAYSAKTGVTTKVSVRAEESGIAALVVASIS